MVTALYRNAATLPLAFRVTLAAGLAAVSGVTLSARAEDPLYAVAGPARTNFTWLAAIEGDVPPLVHRRGARWPTILWECGPLTPQPKATYRMLLARGIAQHIRLDTNQIATARALRRAGSPVIMMQGTGGPWPFVTPGPAAEWAHTFEPGHKPEAAPRPCLLQHAGWEQQAAFVRDTLTAFRDAGVTVAALWPDIEGDPLSRADSYEQARHCTRCRAALSPDVLFAPETFHPWRWELAMELFGRYVAVPAAEVFPRIETTSWMVVVSGAERRIYGWSLRPLPPVVPPGFTARNAVAYGNTACWRREWQPAWTLDREHVDQFYFHLLIEMVTLDEANAQLYAPRTKSFPWVCRWCPDDEDPRIPIMTRERYREVLRHLWLRGVDGMQVFNPMRTGYEDTVVSEVQDAVAIYDEMLAYRDFLDRGEAFGLDVPEEQDDGVVWSGLRLGDRAVVRVFKQGGGTAGARVQPWPGCAVVLNAPSMGQTYMLERHGQTVAVRP